METGEPVILALDEGTSNAKAILVDRQGQVVARASRPLLLTHPQAGWAEQDARQIWQALCAAIDVCCAQYPARVSAVAISNQRESVLAWDPASGHPLSPLISWQCRRSLPLCQRLRDAGYGELIRQRSGLALDPMFSAGKLRWLLDHLPDGHARAAAGELCLGTLDSWLLWQLGGGRLFATDASNAARTQLLALDSGDWDPLLLDLFDIPVAALPAVRPSAGSFGRTQRQGALPAEVPILALIGDSHAALFGQGGFTPGRVKATLGTGSSLMTPIDRPQASSHGLATTVAWRIGARATYALEGNIVNTGGGVSWMARLLGASDGLQRLTRQAAALPDNGGVYFVPALDGLGAPHWQAEARGQLSGLSESTTPAHLMRAALEAIAYQIREVFEAMQQDSAAPLMELWVDGGATRNAWLMQFHADLLQRPVVRSLSEEVSALGAAHLAGHRLGWWPDQAALDALERPRQRFEPRAATSTGLYDGWREALQRVLR